MVDHTTPHHGRGGRRLEGCMVHHNATHTQRNATQRNATQEEGRGRALKLDYLTTFNNTHDTSAILMASREEIAEFLLQKGYLLTALEFYQEQLEDDGTELECLKEHFIKQHPNFDTESPRYKSMYHHTPSYYSHHELDHNK